MFPEHITKILDEANLGDIVSDKPVALGTLSFEVKL
jgi:hypothetical protein